MSGENLRYINRLVHYCTSKKRYLRDKKRILMHKMLRSFDVIHIYDETGEYEFSVLCLYRKLNGNCKDFVRIIYDCKRCEIEGDIDNKMRKRIFADG